MRPFISALLASSLFLASPAFADTRLAPGKPAGVKAARSSEDREALLLGAISGGGLVAGIYLIFFNKKGGTAVVSSTGTAG